MSILYLPEELLDHIVGLLYNSPDPLPKRMVALRNYCLISKSWIPRTRKHLFATIWLHKRSLESWKKAFPDPSTSPTHYTKTLIITNHSLVTIADAEAGGWIRGFSHVVRFEVGSRGLELGASLVPLQGFSPAIKFLRVNLKAPPPSQIVDLVLSFPLLEDLTVYSDHWAVDGVDGPDPLPSLVQPSNPPIFTGSLNLFLGWGIKCIARPLLSLLSGIHFRKLALTWCEEEDPLLTMTLVEKCSHTVETLEVTYRRGASVPHRRCEIYASDYSLSEEKELYCVF